MTVRASPIVHADFYRLSGSYELVELGWDEMTDNAVALVEWPERAEDALKAERLDIRLDFAPGSQGKGRVAMLTGTGAFASRLQRMKAIGTLVERCGWSDAARMPMPGDASVIRSYERLVKPTGETALLMISPPRPVGPPVRRGKPYTTIAKLAETVHAFVAMDKGLRARASARPTSTARTWRRASSSSRISAPSLHRRDGPIPERYAEATRLLAKLHGQTLPQVLPSPRGSSIRSRPTISKRC